MDAKLTEAKRHYKTGNYRKALRDYQAVLDIEPDNAIAYQGMAQSMSRLGQFGEAEKACCQALELNPNLAIPYAILGGGVYFRQQLWQEAEEALRKAIALDPMIEEAYISLGGVLIEQGRLQDAMDVLHTTIEMNPKRHMAYYNLSVAYAQQGKTLDALKVAFRAFQAVPSINTGRAVASYILRYLVEQPIFYLVLISFAILPFVLPLAYAIILSMVVAGFHTWQAILNFQLGNRKAGGVHLLLTIALVTLYACYIVSRFSLRRPN